MTSRFGGVRAASPEMDDSGFGAREDGKSLTNVETGNILFLSFLDAMVFSWAQTADNVGVVGGNFGLGTFSALTLNLAQHV
jgi:hypothetical protein